MSVSSASGSRFPAQAWLIPERLRHPFVEGRDVTEVCENLAKLANADASGRTHVYNFNGLLDLVAVKGQSGADIKAQWDAFVASRPKPQPPTATERAATAEALRAEQAERARAAAAMAAAIRPEILPGMVRHRYVEGRDISEVCANLAKLANDDPTGRVHVYDYNGMFELRAVKGQSGADVQKQWDERPRRA